MPLPTLSETLGSARGIVAAGGNASLWADELDAENKAAQQQQQAANLAFRQQQEQQRQIEREQSLQQREQATAAKQAEQERKQSQRAEIAKAEFTKSTIGPLMTDAQRTKAESEVAKAMKSVRGVAAGTLTDATAKDPNANKTTGGFLGFGAKPTPEAQAVAERAQRAADPTLLNDDDLAQARALNPAPFDELDKKRAALDADAERRNKHQAATQQLARAKAIAAGVPEEDLPAFGADKQAGQGQGNVYNVAAQAGVLDRDAADLSNHESRLQRMNGDLESLRAKKEELKQTLQAGVVGPQSSQLHSQWKAMHADEQARTSMLRDEEQSLLAKRRAFEAKKAMHEEQVAGLGAPARFTDDSPPTIAPEAAKQAAKPVTDAQGAVVAHETSQPDSLEALAKSGSKAFWLDPSRSTAPTPDVRDASTKAANDSVGVLTKFNEERAAAHRDLVRGLADRVRRGEIDPDKAQAEQDKALTTYEKAHEADAFAASQKLDNALRDFQEGRIDSDTLNTVFHAAGSAKSGVEAFKERLGELQKHQDASAKLAKIIVGDGSASDDPGLNGQSLALANEIAQLKEEGSYGLAKEKQTELAQLRSAHADKLRAELTKMGIDAGAHDAIIANAELQATSKVRPGVAANVAAKGGVGAWAAEKLPFVGGVIEAARLLPYAETASKLERGATPSKEELDQLNEFVRFSNQNPTFAAQAVEGLASLPGFAIELALTEGIANTVKLAGMKGLTTALKKMATSEGRELMSKALVKVAEKQGATNLGKRLVSGLAQEAVRLPIASAGRVAEKYMHDAATQGVTLTPDETNLVATIDRTTPNARRGNVARIADAVADTFIENLSERSGRWLGYAMPTAAREALTKMAAPVKERLLKTAIVRSLVSANPGVPMSTLSRVLAKANIGSTLSEMGEERVGDLARDLWKGVSTGQWGITIPTTEQLASEFVTFLVPGAKSALDVTRHFGKLDAQLQASDAQGTQHIALLSKPEDAAAHLSRALGTSIAPDEVKSARDLIGNVAGVDSVRDIDRAVESLMQKSNAAMQSGDLDRASKFRLMALEQSRSRARAADMDMVKAVAAVRQIQDIRRQADTVQQHAAALAGDLSEARLSGEPINQNALQEQQVALQYAQALRTQADRASALVKIARGRDAMLTAQEQRALGDAVEYGPQGSIITDAARDELQQIAPAAADYIRQSETQRREELATATAQTTPQQGDAGAGTGKAAGIAPDSAGDTAEGVVSDGTTEAAPAAGEPKPGVNHGRGESFDADQWRSNALALTAKMPDEAARQHAVATIGAAHGVLRSYGKIFEGGVLFAGNDIDGGMAFDTKHNALHINLLSLAANTRGLHGDELREFLDDRLNHEVIHVAANAVMTREQVIDIWRRLGKHDAGRELMKTVHRAYRAADEARNRPLKELSNFELGHELIRMMVQDKAFAHRISEAVAVDKGLLADLRDFLLKIADWLNMRIAALPASDRTTLESHRDNVIEALRALGVLPANAETAQGGENVMVSNDTEIPTGKLETPKEAAKPAAAKTQVDTKADKKKPDYSRYSEEQQALLRESDEQHAKDVANANSFTDDRDTQQKKLKAAGMRHAARFRQITGKLTAKERAAKDAYEASNHVGKAVSVDGVNGEIVGHAFGRVQVKLATGEVKTVDAEKIGKPAKSNAAQGDQSEGGVVSASGTSAESTASSSFGAVADAEPTIKQPEATSNEIGQGRDNAPGEEVVYQAPEDEAPATPPAPKATKPKAERRKKIMEAINPTDEARNNGFKASDAAIEKARKAFEGLGATERPVAVSAAQDAEYMRAVESGDMETAQRMVDDAAKAAGYNITAWHGSNQPDATFNYYLAGRGGYRFFADYDHAKSYAGSNGTMRRSFLQTLKPLNLRSVSGSKDYYSTEVSDLLNSRGIDVSNVTFREKAPLWSQMQSDGVKEALEKAGYDSVSISETDNADVTRMVFSPSQIKSADPVTRDESGNVIPLSQRFNSDSNSILYATERPTIEQTGLPRDRRAAFMDLADTLIEDGIKQPEELAAFLDRIQPDGRLRKFSQAMWNYLGTVSPELSGTHDWISIYATKKAEQAPEPEFSPSLGQWVIDAEGFMGPVIAVDENGAVTLEAEGGEEQTAKLPVKPTSAPADDTKPSQSITGSNAETPAEMPVPETGEATPVDQAALPSTDAPQASETELQAQWWDSLSPAERFKILKLHDLTKSVKPTTVWARLSADVRAAVDHMRPSQYRVDGGASSSGLEASKAGNVANMIKRRLLEGESISARALDNLTAMAGKSATRKDIDEAAEVGVVMAAREIVRNSADPKATYQALVDLYKRQPSFAAKTSTSKINQAYSTPAPLAFLASRLADVVGGIVIAEPSAGNGMLLIESDSRRQVIEANEIDPARRARLGMQGIKSTQEDATTWTPKVSPDIVIANPPFGQVMEEGGANKVFQTPAGETTSIDHAIVLRSLETMATTGRAVFIIGGPPPTVRTPQGRAEYYRTGKKGAFFAHLYQNNRVVDHFTIPGELYEKQGAGWPIDVIVVAGKGSPSALSLPGRKAPRIIETWEALANELDRTDNDRIEQGRLTEADVQRDADEMVAGLAGSSNLGGLSDLNQGAGGEQASTRPVRDVRAADGPRTKSASGTANQRGAVGSDERGSSEDNSTRDDGQGLASGVVGQPAAVRQTQRGEGEVGSEFQLAYSPASGVNPAGLLAPVNLATPMKEALSTLRSRVGDLPKFVSTKLGYPAGTDIAKYFFGDQIDALAQAIYNIENGGALVIGDQTGTGKGRIAAGLMKYAANRGLTPVFFTKDPTLYDAMLDDLQDIGAPEILPLITNNTWGEEYQDFKKRLRAAGIAHGKEQFEEYTRTGRLPAQANAIFTSYSQISGDDRPGLTPAERAQAKKNEEAPPAYWRMEALKQIAPNALMILDESHIASGASSTGWRLAELLSACPNVYYSSATFAKRPDNMGLYFRTNLGQVSNDMQGLMKVMSDGGVPAMQVASSMLARDGQYMRRERSFAGVRFTTEINTDLYERDKALADNYTDGLRVIVQVQERMAKAADAVNKLVAAAGKNWQVPTGNRMNLESQNFSAKLHNMVRQYLFSIKAGTASQMAINAIKEGAPDTTGKVRPHKVIVAVENTMEGAIKELTERGFPLTFNGMLDMYLDQQREFVVKGGAFGKKKETWKLPKAGDPQFAKTDDASLKRMLVKTGKHPVSGEQTVDINQDALKELIWRAMNGVFVEAQDKLEKLQLADMPLSPIDAMRQAVEAAGIRTGEMTARQFGIDAAGKMYERKEAGRMKAKEDFNNGDLHFLVINKSGSTGVSMHASEKFKDRRPRMMMVVQPNLDINEFMQTIGRIHRAGQVELPSYVMPQTALPAEKRPAAILGSKMAMLNANTTSNADSEVSQKDVIDLFNKYGDEVTWNYLSKNPGLVKLLAQSWPKLTTDGALNPLSDFLGDENGGEGYLSRSVTGHLAILPVDEQEAFWETVETDYRALISYLDAVGQNDLRATVVDMKAKTIDKALFSGGGDESKSVFGEPSWIETVETKMGRKPMDADEVTTLAKELKAGAKAQQTEFVQRADEFIDAEDKRKAVVQNKWDDKRDGWQASQRDVRNQIASAIGMIGSFGAYQRAEGALGYAMLKSVTINEGKPTTPSLQMARLVLNDSRYEISVPLTQLDKFFSPITYGEAEQWAATYDYGSTRSIVTGNLLAAIPMLGGKGQIVSFSTDSGENRMGILLPSGFTKDMQKRNESRDPVTDISRFQARLMDGYTIANASNTVRFSGGDGTYYLYVPASRAAGGKYWRDPALNRLMDGGEFRQIGNTMVGTMSQPGKAADVFDYLSKAGERFFSPRDKSSDDQGGKLSATERPGLYADPEFAAAMEELTTPGESPFIPLSDAARDLVRDTAGAKYGPDFTAEEAAQVAMNLNGGITSAYQDQREREKQAGWIATAAKILQTDGLDSTADELLADPARLSFNPVKVKLALMVADQLAQRALLQRSPADRDKAERLMWAYNVTGTQAGRAVAARDHVHASKEELHRRAIANKIFTPPAHKRAAIERAISLKEKNERIAELERQLEEVRTKAAESERGILGRAGELVADVRGETGKARAAANAQVAALNKQIADLRAQRDQSQLLAEANQARIAAIEADLARDFGLTLHDLFVSREALVRLRGSAIVKNALAGFNQKEALAQRLRMEGKSDRQISKQTGMSEKALADVFARVDEALSKQLEPWLDRGFSLGDFEQLDDQGNRIDPAKIIDDKGNLLGATLRAKITPEEKAARLKAILGAINSTAEARNTGALKRTARFGDGNNGFGFDLNRPEHAAMVARAIQRTDGNASDMIYEYWINGLLSGPATQTANIAGNTASMALEFAIQRPLEAMINATIFRDAAGAQLGEFRSMAKYASMIFATAVNRAKRAWQTEISTFDAERLDQPLVIRGGGSKNESEQFVIGGTPGRVIRTPSRLLNFADEFSKYLIGGLEAAAQAHRLAKANGLTGEEFDKFVASQVNTNGSQAWLAAVDKAHRLTFTSELPDMLKKANDMLRDRATTPGGAALKFFLRMVFPFVRTPYNIFATGLRKTPLGTLRMAGKATAGLVDSWKGTRPFFDSYPKAALAGDMAEQLVGWVAALVLAGMAEGDPDDERKHILITGTRSQNDSRGEAQLLNRTRGGETTILINGKPVFNYGRIEPFATVISTLVDAIREWKKVAGGEPPAKAIENATRALADQARSKTFLQGFDGLMQLIDGRTRSLPDAAVKAIVTGAVPNLVRQPLRNVDGFARDTRNAPWYYQALPLASLAEPLYDLYGRPIQKDFSPLARIALGSATTKIQPIQPADRALERWNKAHEGDPQQQYNPVHPSVFRFKDAQGKWQQMRPDVIARFRRDAGRAFAADAIAQFASPTAPAAEEVRGLRSVKDRSYDATKKNLLGAGVQPPKVARPMPTLAEVFGQRLR